MSVVPSAVRTVKAPTLPPPDDDPRSRLPDYLRVAEADHVDDKPTAEDREWMSAVNLDSHLDPDLDFAGWLAEQARQHQLREDRPWHQWLARKIDELAQLAVFMDASTSEAYDARLGVFEEESKERAYCAGYRAAEQPEPEYGYGQGR